jgi:hypothetical protein
LSFERKAYAQGADTGDFDSGGVSAELRKESEIISNTRRGASTGDNKSGDGRRDSSVYPWYQHNCLRAIGIALIEDAAEESFDSKKTIRFANWPEIVWPIGFSGRFIAPSVLPELVSWH